MEKKSSELSRGGAHSSSGRAAARSSGTGGARHSAGASGARCSSAGTARSSHPAARSGGRASTGSGAHAAAKRRAASGAHRSGKRRGRSARLSGRDPRLWIIVGAFVVAIALAVILALTLPTSSNKDDVLPANPPAQDAANVASEGEIASPDGGAAVDGALGEPESPEAAQVNSALEDVPSDGAESPEAAPVADVSEDGSEDEADDAASLSPEMVEMMQKYQVLDDIPSTAQPLGLAETARVDDSYFDDALFVGDSVTLKLQEYVVYTRKHGEPTLLGGARFLAAQSFSARNALMKVSSKSIHPVLNGNKMTLEDAIAQLAPKKLYLMLGMNDVGISGIDGALENMGKLLARIREKNPDMQIIVESATPRLKGSHPTTKQLFAYDVRLYDAILKLNDPNIHFLDVGYTMRDEQGKLPEEYCFDPDTMGIHFTNSGCRHWIDFLYTHALA